MPKSKTPATKKPAAKKAAPTKAAPTVKITDSTAISFQKARPKKGPKTVLLGLVPRKGSITLKALTAKAEAEGIKPARVVKFVAALARYGYVDLVA
jgi:hypothetical protein